MKNKNRSSMLRKNVRQSLFTLILSGVTVISLLLVVTFSWFVNNKETSLDEFTAEADGSPNLYIGTSESDFINWGTSFDLSSTKVLNPICGNGVEFFKACYTYKYNDPLAYITDAFKTIKVEKDYSAKQLVPYSYESITQSELISGKYVEMADFYIKSSVGSGLYLSTDSVLTPNIDNSPTSIYSDELSTGYIAGAFRVAILQYDEVNKKYDLKCVWIPNKDYEFDISNNSFTENGDVEEKYYFVNKTDGTSTEIETKNTEIGSVSIGNVLYVWDISKCNDYFTVLEQDVEYKFRVIIWLDGTDRECVDALSGGLVNLKLGFKISV